MEPSTRWTTRITPPPLDSLLLLLFVLYAVLLEVLVLLLVLLELPPSAASCTSEPRSTWAHEPPTMFLLACDTCCWLCSPRPVARAESVSPVPKACMPRCSASRVAGAPPTAARSFLRSQLGSWAESAGSQLTPFHCAFAAHHPQQRPKGEEEAPGNKGQCGMDLSQTKPGKQGANQMGFLKAKRDAFGTRTLTAATDIRVQLASARVFASGKTVPRRQSCRGPLTASVG